MPTSRAGEAAVFADAPNNRAWRRPIQLETACPEKQPADAKRPVHPEKPGKKIFREKEYSFATYHEIS
jgi:hypothetical protein